MFSLPTLVAIAISAGAASAHGAGDRDAQAVHGFNLPFEVDPNVLLVGLVAIAILVFAASLLYYAFLRGTGGMVR